MLLYQLLAVPGLSGLCWPVSLSDQAVCSPVLGFLLHAQEQLAVSLWVQAEGAQRPGRQQVQRLPVWLLAVQHQPRSKVPTRCPVVMVQQ